MISIPIMLYNNPVRSNVDRSAELVVRLETREHRSLQEIRGGSEVYGYLFCEVLHEFDLVRVSESRKVAAGDELHWHTGCLADIE